MEAPIGRASTSGSARRIGSVGTREHATFHSECATLSTAPNATAESVAYREA
jgi:hypothetical protein